MTGDNLIDLAVEAAARAAAREALQAYRREVRLAQRNDTLAATIGAGPTGNRIATALAGAYLAVGVWRRPALAGATRAVLGTAPRWIYAVLDEILDAYHRPPTDRPRELARFIAGLRTFRTNVPGAPGASPETKPLRIRARPVTSTTTMRRPFGTPLLDDVADLAAWLGLSILELDWYADPRGMNRRASDRRLRHYRYLWLNGRLIEAPKPRLRALQRRVLADLLGVIPTHPAAHGFVPARSPHTFAAPHAGQPMVIRLDVTSFFASVTATRVFGLFRAAGYPEPVAHTLTALCTTRTPSATLRSAPAKVPDRDYRLALLRAPHLPQGAPTSPALANLCGFRLDRRLAGLADVYQARYTRYADDLAFSGRFTRSGAARFVQRVNEIVADEGFRLNMAKTRIRGRGDRQALAGLVVNSSPAVPRHEYDALRALLHNAARTGLAEQNRDGHADFAAYLAGRIAWVGHLHPARAAKLQALFAQALAT
jgi:RNA-directed DNA polymerase